MTAARPATPPRPRPPSRTGPGTATLDPGLTVRQAGDLPPRHTELPCHHERFLTDPDARIIEGIAVGLSTLTLASRLHFSPKYVDYRISRLMRRLHAPNRTALVARAFSLGMLDATNWPPKVVEDFVA
ncbi:LuxR C-terminal-related transcriptional regulator [Streptomyces coffeae]|uniref:HTH luxR-type domain-containing protein n=1 Tax=Streptomyces coffeae TaxID=621382 RepID=A0ABS1NBF7_9ACTN|nr:LuxR C-terminal-related transcriptional regulator [Streptomyces coffeae]MBL1097388.1 hypothetical protein [Streptomyces coffeae]